MSGSCYSRTPLPSAFLTAHVVSPSWKCVCHYGLCQKALIGAKLMPAILLNLHDLIYLFAL